MEARGIAEVEWAVVAARNGDPVLELAGRATESTFQPRRDAARLAAGIAHEARAARATFVILLGAGLGALGRALRASLDVPLIVFEPFGGLAKATTPWLAAAGGEAPDACSLDALARALALLALPGARPHVAVHPGYAEPCRFEARWLARRLRAACAPEARLAASDAIVSERALSALDRLARTPTVDDLTDALADGAAFVVSPGPSLADALPVLAARRGGVVVAALQALRPLVAAGVRVDFVVAPDPFDWEPFLREVEPRFGALLAEASVRPDLLSRFPDRTFLFALQSRQLHQVAWDRLGLAAVDEPVMTVSETAVVLARRLGARRIVCVGMDFASDDPRYAFRFRARGAEGLPQTTNSHYFHGARCLGWLARAYAARGCELLRLVGGLAVDGPRPIALPQLEALAQETSPALALAPAPPPPRERREAIAALLGDADAASGTAAADGEGSGPSGEERWRVFAPLGAPERVAGLRAVRGALGAEPR